ncbi:MAG: transglutaminase family protein [Caulobacteraceae bacterium]|nr:transglutaminase family protein [Caulobacteraceae bacterium]
MLIRAGYEIAYECPAPTPLQLLLNVHSSRRRDLVTQDTMHNDRGAPMTQYFDLFGNLCTRVLAPAGRIVFSSDFFIEDSGEPDPVAPQAAASPVETLPDEVMVYLLGSRYCETDQMTDLAWGLFENTPPGWARVQAIVDYVHERIDFGYHHARPTKSAREAHEERCGVCRDFAHLAVTLCRCMNIPARYCTGYLGDIGVPPVDAPMDFSAWFEAWLDGGWRTFDARHNAPRIGRIPVAYGRDATDTAITTAFGTALLAKFSVVTDEVPEPRMRAGAWR